MRVQSESEVLSQSSYFLSLSCSFPLVYLYKSFLVYAENGEKKDILERESEAEG